MLKGKLAVAFQQKNHVCGNWWLLAYTLSLSHVLYFEIITWKKIKET